MSAGLYLPDAVDLDVLTIDPARTFEICNPLLGGSRVTDEFHQANGYLFFRDVLVVHPSTPHAGMPNRSNRLRISLDVRIQSAANPTAFAGVVQAVTPTSIRIAADDAAIGDVLLTVDAETFIRVLSPGIREPFDRFADYTRPEMRLSIVRDGNRPMMLRSGSNP